MWNMERIRLTASEEMLFENVDGRVDGRTTDDGRTDRRTPDACIYYARLYLNKIQNDLFNYQILFYCIKCSIYDQ